MKTQTKLARVLTAIGAAEQQTESTAAGIFAVIRTVKVRAVKEWDKLVREAYAANGWNTRAGRPANGAAAQSAVPSTVRTYVTIVRQAIRRKLKLASYKSFTALRADLAKKSGRRNHRGNGNGNGDVPEKVAESFVGVRVEALQGPNGALFHDLAGVFVHLPGEHQNVLGRQLARLMAKYMPLAKGFVPRLPKPEPVRKAA